MKQELTQEQQEELLRTIVNERWDKMDKTFQEQEDIQMNKNPKITLEEYKKKVEESLVKNNNCSTQEVNKLMKEYENDFQEFMNQNYKPEMVSLGMVMNYL